MQERYQQQKGKKKKKNGLPFTDKIQYVDIYSSKTKNTLQKGRASMTQRNILISEKNIQAGIKDREEEAGSDPISRAFT